MPEVTSLFDRIRWRDPLSGRALEPIVFARTPSGVPVCGALRIEGTDSGYPIVDCVARVTPELAERHRSWLEMAGLRPPQPPDDAAGLQPEATVESFGWQWTWNSDMRSDADLKMRVADRFGVAPESFAGQLTLDAGAGAGDQTRYIARQGGDVVSVDLSSAIEVVSSKMRMEGTWFGVQGDVTALPFASDQFDVVYCEGVIQHTRDSVATVRELCRTAKPGGRVFASHYTRRVARSALHRLVRKVRLGYYEFLRSRLSRMERFKLLFVCGVLAALAYVPLLGRFVRWSATALWYELMPDFKTTWTNTYDYYGAHAFQRIIPPDEFAGYFDRAGGMEIRRPEPGVVVATKSRSA
jgi:ubiquinone/menaquinone biosynthesis C-methylase UbiE